MNFRDPVGFLYHFSSRTDRIGGKTFIKNLSNMIAYQKQLQVIF